jgi:hypothetical protein
MWFLRKNNDEKLKFKKKILNTKKPYFLWLFPMNRPGNTDEYFKYVGIVFLKIEFSLLDESKLTINMLFLYRKKMTIKLFFIVLWDPFTGIRVRGSYDMCNGNFLLSSDVDGTLASKDQRLLWS